MPEGIDPERELARNAKKTGHTKDEYLNTRLIGVFVQAKENGWSAETLQAAQLDIVMLADEIWGASPQ